MTHTAVRNNYNSMSRYYDLFARSEKRFTDIGLHMLNIQPGEKVLEIGFGTGQSLVNMAYSIKDTGRVYGIDLSDGMVRVANERIARSGLSCRIDLYLGDANTLPFKVNSFDAIFISFTLELFSTSEITNVLAECKRVLQNNGRLGVVALKKKDCQAVRIYEWFHSLIPSVVDCCPIEVYMQTEAAGLEPIAGTYKFMWGLPVEIMIARKSGQ
jgi:ubiquinone/menaquinone biosynthesis C-methylase UbiE